MTREYVAGEAFARWLPAAYAGLLLAVGLVALRFVWSDSLGSFADDSVSYVLMAQCWSPYSSPSPAVAEACAVQSYPPLFPWLLAISGVSHQIALAHGLVVALLLATGITLYLFALAVLRSHAAACAVGAVFLIAPVTWLSVMSILSENLYMLLVLGALLVHERGLERDEPDRASALILTLLLGGAMLTRTVGVSLLGAFLLTALFGDRRRRHLALYPVLAAVLVTLVWYLTHPPGGEVSYGADIRSALFGLVSGDQGAWSQLAPQLDNILASWFSSFLIYWLSVTDWNYVLVALFGACALLGTLLRLLDNRPDGWYVLGYLGILVIWPYPGQIPRFLYALLPVMIVHGAVGLLAVARLLKKEIAPAWLALPLSLVLLTSASALSFIYFRAGYDGGFPGLGLSANPDYYRKINIDDAVTLGILQASLFEDMERLRETVPEDGRILWFTPGYVALLADRRSTKIPPLDGGKEFLRAVLDSAADYVLLSRFQPRKTRADFNGLIWYPTFSEIAQVVWVHPHPRTKETLSVLMRIDRERIRARLGRIGTWVSAE